MSNILPPVRTVSFQRVLDSVLDVICVFDTSGRFVYVTQASLSLLGFNPNELIGRSFRDFIVPDDIAITERSAQQLLEGYFTTHFENRYNRKDGSIVHLTWSGKWDAGDQLFYYVVRDASAKGEDDRLRTLYAKELKRRNAENREVLERITDGFFIMDEEWRITFTNSQVEKILPLNREEYLSRNYWECFPDMVGSVYYEQYHRALREKVPVHFESYFPPFQKWLDVSAYPSQNGLTVFFRDVTQKRKVEEELRNLSLIAKETVNVVLITTPEGKIIWVNDAFTRITGYTFEEAAGKTARALFNGPETDPETIRFYEQQLQKGVAFQMEILNYTKSGRTIWAQVFGQPLFDAAGHLQQFFFIGTDITDRKNAEEEVRMLSLIVKENNHMIATTDAMGHITWVNDAFVKATGFTSKEAVGNRLSSLLSGPETDPNTISHIIEQFKKGEGFHVEIVRYTKGKRKFWSDVYYQAVKDTKGKTYRFFVLQIDITERKELQERLEEEMRQRQQMITTAIIKTQENERALISKELHDNVNQVLTTVKLYLELCISGFENSEEMMKTSMHLLQQSIGEIRNLSKRLSAPSLGSIKLQDSVKELIESVNATHKVFIRLDTAGIEDLDVDQEVHLAVYRILQEHMTNILKHAQAQTVAVSLDFDENALIVKVRDDGKGFDLNQKRSGIGITNMKTRTENLNGTFTINSTSGRGTELMLRIPLAL